MKSTLLCLAMAMAITAGCSSADEGGAEGTAEDSLAAEPAGEEPGPVEDAAASGGSASLERTSWRLIGFGPDETVSEGIEITAEFAEGRMAGRSGCNRYTGPVEFDAAAGTLETGAFISTKMACPPPQMESETRYLGALENVTGFEIAEGRLTLLAGDVQALVFERAEETT